MSPLSDRVSTVVLVMLENRSFDHMLGHLSYENLVPDVDGLGQKLSIYENLYKGAGYTPFHISPAVLSSDLPHEWDQIQAQLAFSPVRQQFDMNGFVAAYEHLRRRNLCSRSIQWVSSQLTRSPLRASSPKTSAPAITGIVHCPQARSRIAPWRSADRVRSSTRHRRRA